MAFNLHSRQMLCDYILQASLFVSNRSKTKQGSEVKNYSIPPSHVNYQRTTPTTVDPDPEILKYRPHRLQIGPKTRFVNMLPCVIWMHFKWYVTYGFTDTALYLLEPLHNATRVFRLFALIELSAGYDPTETYEDLFNDFRSQIMTDLCM